MQICQNPSCSNPFNSDSNRFCTSCGQNNFGNFLRNRYRVLGLLGEGGFSRTYATEDVDRLDAPCVIKQFFPQIQGTSERTKAAQLFKEEAKRLYELGENHWQIPRLLAYFEQGSSLYLVQEFIQGQTLLQELQQQPFSEEKIRDLLEDLLPVLQFIHERNVIHRDIKPENIIRRQTDGKLVLIDFGGAKQVTQTSLSRQATVLYTIGYAPSEQMAGFACQASDLYALGVTCARLMTQCLPIQNPDGGQIQDTLYNPMNGEWLWREYLQEKGVTIGNDLREILDKLLKHLAKDRYQSATEVLQELNATKFFAQPIVPIPQAKSLRFEKHKVTTPISERKASSELDSLQTFNFDVVTVDAQGDEISRECRNAKFYAENLGNEVTLEMVGIPGDTFMMGSKDNEGDGDERPQHPVSIKPFFMGKFPVTQAQWKAVAALPKVKQSLNPYPSKFKGANRPVENISWHEAIEFCTRLFAKTGRLYRLPSEAEWEYACRAGTTTPFHFGETITTQLANCSQETQTWEQKPKNPKETTPVGSFQVANAFGLYDMHGLVWEWCADPWHKNYDGAPTDGSVWEVGGDDNRRVLRGGSWSFSSALCRSASRSWNEPDGGLRICGFRVVSSWSV